MQKITIKEQAIINAIIEYTTQYGYSPTIQELAAMVGMKSIGSVSSYIRKLEKKGILTTEEKFARTMRVRGYGYLDERSEVEKHVEGKTYQRTLESISTWILTKGYAPSIREICILTGIQSTSTIHKHLNYLQDLQKIDMCQETFAQRALRVNGIKYGRLGE